MIWNSAQDRERPVDLLQEQNPHHLVGPCHLAERKRHESPGANRVPQPFGAADDEGELSRSVKPLGLEPAGELDRSELPSTGLQDHHPRTLPNPMSDLPCLRVPQVGPLESAPLSRIPDLDHLASHQPPRPLEVVVAQAAEVRVPGFPDPEEHELHRRGRHPRQGRQNTAYYRKEETNSTAPEPQKQGRAKVENDK